MVEHDAYLVAQAQGVFVFNEPTDAHGVVTRLRCGERVYATGGVDPADAGWVEVFGGALAAGGQADRGDRGWVRADALTACDAREPHRHVPSPDPRQNQDGWRRVTALSALGFNEATRKRQPAVLDLPCGAWVRSATMLRAEGSGDDRGNPLDTADWVRIAIPDGQSAWVQTSDVTFTGGSLLTELHHLVGRPYVWGGSDGQGLDCSGLVTHAARWRVEHPPHQTNPFQYRRPPRFDTQLDGHPHWLPHSARRQFSEDWPALQPVGEDRTPDDVAGDLYDTMLRDAHAQNARRRWFDLLQPGDLVYFAMGAKRIDHVGFVATREDNGKVLLLHASSAGTGGQPYGPRVRYETLLPAVHDPYTNRLAARWVGLRRFSAEVPDVPADTDAPSRETP